jgi:hypothetical protein
MHAPQYHDILTYIACLVLSFFSLLVSLSFSFSFFLTSSLFIAMFDLLHPAVVSQLPTASALSYGLCPDGTHRLDRQLNAVIQQLRGCLV